MSRCSKVRCSVVSPGKFSPPVARNLANELGRLSPSIPILFEAEVRRAFRGGVESHEKGYGQSTQIERQGEPLLGRAVIFRIDKCVELYAAH
ncbi:hypothetical protein F442_09114 [Phytophthora nicotianae P10297]|uniref:Uncharacterized protein n=1 Tax=Phytophthora nicotianae P10297 TaxID=1317064 RepID=W2ZB40_PHYNI|nr:hypothetical protein F442_09114 [Phytophthora nicotianae P10297]